MINISSKLPTHRSATAHSTLYFSHAQTHASLSAATNKKGDAIAVARIAAIQAAKQTSNLIPLAHPGLSITGVSVDVTVFTATQRRSEFVSKSKGDEVLSKSKGEGDGERGEEETETKYTKLDARFGGVKVSATVSCDGKTGVEMEALMAASIGTITLYDMLKGVDKGMVIMDCRVVRKSGGKSGGWRWDEGRQELVRDGNEDEGGKGLGHEYEQEQVDNSRRVDTSSLDRVDMQNKYAGEPVSTGKFVSDVQEWNQGLADEFSVPHMHEDTAPR